MEDLETLRSQCEELTSSTTVDRDTALGILRLFHSAELLHEQHKRNHEVERVQHDLALLRQSCQNTEVLDDMARQIAHLKAQLVEMQETVAHLQQRRR